MLIISSPFTQAQSLLNVIKESFRFSHWRHAKVLPRRPSIRRWHSTQLCISTRFFHQGFLGRLINKLNWILTFLYKIYSWPTQLLLLPRVHAIIELDAYYIAYWLNWWTLLLPSSSRKEFFGRATRVYATHYSAISIRWLVHWSVGLSVTHLFFGVFSAIFASLLLPNCSRQILPRIRPCWSESQDRWPFESRIG